MNNQPDLKSMFDRSAADYDNARPGYPDELVDDVVKLSDIPDGGRILEIGCGTGKATQPFAKRGYELVCLDIGENLLEIARERLSQFKNVSFQLNSFEDWAPDGRPFDLGISASAFHWVDPRIGYQKIADLLKPDGTAAIFTHYHPTPMSGFFHEVQSVYERVVPEWPDPGDGPDTDEVISSRRKQVEDSGRFGPVTIKKYAWTKAFTTDEYVRLLNTYSGHRALDEDRRRELFEGIADVIRNRYEGKISRPYLTVLYLAQKRS